MAALDHRAAAGMPFYRLPPVRRAFEQAAAAVGIEEAYGRDAVLVEPAQGNGLIPWTRPASEHEAMAWWPTFAPHAC